MSFCSLENSLLSELHSNMRQGPERLMLIWEVEVNSVLSLFCSYPPPAPKNSTTYIYNNTENKMQVEIPGFVLCLALNITCSLGSITCMFFIVDFLKIYCVSSLMTEDIYPS